MFYVRRFQLFFAYILELFKTRINAATLKYSLTPTFKRTDLNLYKRCHLEYQAQHWPPSWIFSASMDAILHSIAPRAEPITTKIILNFLPQLVLPLLFLVIRENTAKRIGENTKSKRHQKINNAFLLFHSVFIKSRPYHLRLISVSTTGCVKNCRKNEERNQFILLWMWSYQASTFLIQVTCIFMQKEKIKEPFVIKISSSENSKFSATITWNRFQLSPPISQR